MGESFNRDIITALNLYDSLIKPILTYASDFWGCLKLPQNNPIETLHMKVLKQILGVQKQTTNIGVLLELGRTPLDIDCIKLGVKNWERIRKGEANDILVSSYIDATGEQLPWILGIRKNLETNGLLSLYTNEYPDKPPFIAKKLHTVLVDQFHQDAIANIKKENSKLRTYALFKSVIGMEEYLTEIKNVSIRIQITKFRISNHKLMIKTGRHLDIKPHLRFCPFCKNVVECEIHFITGCRTYGDLRAGLYREMVQLNESFPYLSRKDQFIFILTHSQHSAVASYIKNGLELRDYLLANPRRLD